jgi:nucleoside-diphosphate-sugar epimerase/pimeloyl-ACP methyl ester carboxylesterase
MRDKLELGVIELSEWAARCRPATLMVTGATGFIGRHFLFWRLQGPGTVHVLVRAGDRAAAESRVAAALTSCAASYGLTPDVARWGDRLVVHVADAVDDEWGLAKRWDRRIRVDEVWHFAACLNFEDRHRDLIFATNVDGTERLLRLSHRLEAGRFVHVSTAYSVGRFVGSVPEKLHGVDREFNNWYEASKARAEQLVVDFGRARDMPVAIVRPSIVMGPSSTRRTGGTTAGVYGFARQCMRLQDILNKSSSPIVIRADPEAHLNLMPVDHVVRDMLHLSACGFAGGPVHHATATHEVSVGRVLELVCQHSGVHPFVCRLDPQERSPLEKMLDKYTTFYGSYLRDPKRFERSLPFPSGMTADDLDRSLANFVHESKAKREGAPADGRPVAAGSRTPLAACAWGDAGTTPVLIINAYGMPPDFVDPLAARLAGKHRVITWTSRDVPVVSRDFDEQRCGIDAQVDDALAVLESYGVQRAHVVGWCSGAQVALELVRRRPASVASLALVNGAFGLPDGVPKSDFHHNLLKIMKRIAESRAVAARYCDLIYGGDATSSTDGARVSGLLTTVDPFLLHLTSAPFRDPESLYRYAHFVLRLFGDREKDEWTTVSVPTVVVTGSKDTIAHPDASADIARQIPGAQLVCWPEGDHFVLYYDAAKLADAVAPLWASGELPALRAATA